MYGNRHKRVAILLNERVDFLMRRRAVYAVLAGKIFKENHTLGGNALDGNETVRLFYIGT